MSPLVLVLVPVLVLSGGSACRAQAPAAYRFYVDAQLAKNKYVVDYATGANVAGASPWSLAVGYHLFPRLAVQAGLLYTADTFVSYNAGTTLARQPLTDVRTYQNWNTAVPVLARFALIRTADRRFKVDALAGGTYFFAHARFEEVITVAGQVTSARLDEVRKGGLFATAGFGARFIGGRRWEIVGDWTYSHNAAPISRQAYQRAGKPSGWAVGQSIGARYRFNLKKPAAAGAAP